MMSLSRVRVSSKRFDTSSQSSSSSLLTSTPVLGRPILTNEPAQSPIEQKNSSQTVVTPARANPAPIRGRLSLSSVSLNESSNCGYRTRSRSRILESSSFLDQSKTPKRNSKTAAVKVHKLALPLKPEGDNIGSENAEPNVKKSGAMFSIFKPNYTSPLTRSRTEASIRGVREKQSTKTAFGRYGSTGNIRKSITDDKENAPKPKPGAKINNEIPQKKLSSEKIISKVKVLQKQSLESQIPIKKQNKILAKSVINNKKNQVDLPALRKGPAPPQTKKPAPPQSKKPTPPQSKKPAPPQSEEPAPPQSKEPAPPQSKKSAPPQSKKPAPPQSKKPAPPQSEKPAPPQSKEHAPPQSKEQAPPQSKKPAPPQSKESALPQSKEPAPPQSKESDLSQRNITKKEMISLQKFAQPVNGRKSTRMNAAEVASKEKSFTQHNNTACNNTPLADDAYSNNNAAEDSCHCIVTRISDNWSKPSFMRRKLYSRTSDYDDNESTKQVDRSFLEKKDKPNLYSFNKKESNCKNIESVCSSVEDGEQLELPAKAAESRQYGLRKNVKKNFTEYFCDNNEKIIDCAIKDANDAKESTSKLVSNILKNINRQNISKEHPSDDTDKVTAKDQTNDEASNKKTKTVNPELDDSSFDIFTQKEKDASKSPTRGKAKSKVSKAKPPKKKIIKPTVKKVLDIPKKRSREKPKNKESVREQSNAKIVKSSTKALEKPATAGSSRRNKNKSIIVEKTYSYVLRKSDQASKYSNMDGVVSNIQNKDVIKGTRVASKAHIQKALEINSTQRRMQISQTHNRKVLVNMEQSINHHRKDHNQLRPLGTANNDSTIVFRNGKLIPGNFGDKTCLSSLSFYNHSSNIDREAAPNVKLNFKTNFKDLYRGINDFETFERLVHKPLETPFFDRTAMNIARETRQHMAHSQYVFKNPSNVLWNPKPSLEYTVCVGNKYGEGAFTNSTSSSNFRKQIKQGRNPFDMSTKYGIERSISSSLKHGRTVPNNNNHLSFCFPKKGSSILKTTGQDLLHKTLNKMITLPAYAEERNVKTARRTYGRDSQINERIRNSHTVQSTNTQLSHVACDNYHREPLNMNLGEGVSDFGDFNDDQYQILNKQHTTTLSNPMRKHPQPSYGGTFADSFQIPLARSEYPISNTGRMQNLYKFGENSEYRNFNVPELKSRSAGLGRSTDIYSTADRVPEFHCDQGGIPRERPRNAFQPSRQTTQVSNYYSSQNQSRNPAVSTKQHSLDYNESNDFKMPIDRPRKRKMVNEPLNDTENELKKYRFDDSRFSTASNIGSSTHISSFYSTKEKFSNGKSVATTVMKSSTAISPVKKITERAMDINDEPMVMNDNHDDLHGGTVDEDDSRSNYFSDNEHEDTVIITNNYTSIKDKPKESVPIVEKRPHPTTVRESTSVAAATNNKNVPIVEKRPHPTTVRESTSVAAATNNKNVPIVEKRPRPTTVKESTSVAAAANKKYVICDDEVSNIISKNNDHRDGDDDTFFFKGSYTTPSITSEIADLNSICSSKPFSSTSRMENSKIGAGNTTRLGADFTKKYSLAVAVAHTSSAQTQNITSAPIQKSNPVLFDSTFKKPAVVDNRSKLLESPTPNIDGKVSRLANSSPWRFSEANNDDKTNSVANCSPWRFCKW